MGCVDFRYSTRCLENSAESDDTGFYLLYYAEKLRWNILKTIEPKALVAQGLERLPVNATVVCSIPTRGNKTYDIFILSLK